MLIKDNYNFHSTPYRIDRKLYKYFSNVGNAIDSIKKKRIHLDNPQKFNDPFEAAFCCSQYSYFLGYQSETEIVKKIRDYIIKSPFGNENSSYYEMIKALADLNYVSKFYDKEYTVLDIIKEVYRQFGQVVFSFDKFCEAIDKGFFATDRFMHVECKMSCFSEINDSILMWSYYANCHKGVCVEYDLTKLDQRNPLNREITKNISKVHYSPLRADVLHANSEENYKNLLFSKADIWAHEHEWRLVCETEEEFLPFDCVSGVYLGAKFDTNTTNYQLLLDIMAELNYVSFKRCEFNPYKYQIDFRDVFDTDLHRDLIKYTKKNNLKRYGA